MAKYTFPKAEQETILRFDANLDEAHLFTAYPPMRRKIEKAGVSAYKVSRMNGVECGWFFKIPYRALRWRVRLAPVTRKQGGSSLQNRFKRKEQSR